MNLRPYWPMLAAALVIGLASRLTDWTAPTPEPATRAERQPDYFADGIRMALYGSDGRVRDRLTGARIERFSDDRRVVITAPLIESAVAGGNAWLLTAPAARRTGAERTVHLDGDVRLEHRQRSGAVPTVVTTRDLAIDLDRRIAETPAATRIVHGPTTLEGKGMRLHLAGKGRLELLSAVRGTHSYAN